MVYLASRANDDSGRVLIIAAEVGRCSLHNERHYVLFWQLLGTLSPACQSTLDMSNAGTIRMASSR